MLPAFKNPQLLAPFSNIFCARVVVNTMLQVVLGIAGSVVLAGASFKIRDRIKDFNTRSNLQVHAAMMHVNAYPMFAVKEVHRENTHM